VGLQVLNFAVIVCTALMVWKGLSVLANTESPIVVVLRCADPIVVIAAVAKVVHK